jgi:hypothetical protein
MNNITRLLALIFLLVPSILFADSFSAYIENDVYENSDGFYTHGTQLEYTHNIDSTNVLGIKGSQEIFTPSDKNNPLPEYGDRPYAGWLHGDVYWERYYDNHWIDHYELSLGVVGPYSGGELAQKTVHKWLENKQPQGWQYQLLNEPTIQICYGKTYSVFLNDYVELRPEMRLNAGNVLDDFELIQTIRFGYNIPKDFEPRISIKGLSKKYYFYGFLGVAGAAIARNLFLDGNTFRADEDVVTVEHRPIVCDGIMGICLGINYVEITITHVEQTDEFYGQPRDERYDALKIRYIW